MKSRSGRPPRAASASEWNELEICLRRAFAAVESQKLRQDLKVLAKHQVRQFRRAAELGRFRASMARSPRERRTVDAVTIHPPKCDACIVWSDGGTKPAVLRLWASLPVRWQKPLVGWQYLCRRCLAGGWFDPNARVWEMCDPKDTDRVDELTGWGDE